MGAKHQLYIVVFQIKLITVLAIIRARTLYERDDELDCTFDF